MDLISLNPDLNRIDGFSFVSSGKSPLMNRGARRYSNLAAAAAALENTITPPVKVEHTKLLIGGKFVDSASGEILILSHFALY